MKRSLRATRMARRPRAARSAVVARPVTVAVLGALYGGLALADQTGATAPVAEAGALQEIVVTATRRAESAQNIPISITAISGATLEQAGISDTVDLGHSLAGINVTDKGAFGGVNGSSLIIRGLNSDSTSGEFIQSSPIVQPVATYVDDTPLFFNLRLQDLDRVEILRGPQGTLYGSGSLGGTIRFVQKRPDPSGFDARVEAGVSDTEHSHGLNEDVKAMLNVPLAENLALRLNAGYTGEAGFINQPNLYVLDAAGAPVPAQAGNLLSPPKTYAADGVNSYIYRTLRVAALWQPSDAVSVELNYHHQQSSADGYPYAAPYYGLAALSSSDYIPASTDDRVDLGALTVAADLGFATLTSNSSYAKHSNATIGDVTSLYDNFPFYSALYGMNPRVLVTGHQGFTDKPWAEEIRLASKPGKVYDWVGGLFYKDEKTTILEHDFYPGYSDYYNACVSQFGAGNGINPSQCGIGEVYPGPPSTIDGIPIVKDQAYIGDFETRYTDLAAFGEFTWHLSDAWALTGGARIFRQTVTQSQQTGLLFDGPGYVANESQSDTWRKALWKVNLAYHIDEQNLAYATWSQGFRRGAINALPPNEAAVGYATPPGLFKVAPDTVDNYEIGAKGTLLGHLRYSAAIYDMRWHNVQQSAFLTPLALPGAVNIGEADSRGFESQLYAMLDEHWAAHLDYTYDETKLKSYSALALQGLTVPPPPPGSALPGTPKNTAAAGLEYGHVSIGPGELRLAADAYYRSQELPALSVTIPTVPSYTMIGARASYAWSHWTTTLWGDNLTNRIGVNSYTDPVQWGKYYQALVSRPRTFGLTVTYSLKER
jgi:iron complex outermembrane receptor protein